VALLAHTEGRILPPPVALRLGGAAGTGVGMEARVEQDRDGREPKALLALVPGRSPTEREDPENTVLSFPWLVGLEGLASLLCLVALLVASLVAMAPLEGPANPAVTPNPAKAPWYFVGLQELLHYFDPWIAGVVLPGLILIGLMALPYIDLSPRAGIGRFSWAERRFEIISFGIAVMGWFTLIAIGLFFRGPGWEWYWPWESWAVHKEPPEGLITFGMVAGGAFLGAYTAVVVIIAAVLRRRRCPDAHPLRYVLNAALVLVMLGVPLKIIMRLLFDVKYVLHTPWFSI
jgi:hypothetical protein